MAVNVRASLRRALAQLQTQRTRIDREISALEGALAALQGASERTPAKKPSENKKASEQKSPRARRKMSAKASRKARGGPWNWDSLLRWDPDQGEGVWNATEETELSC